MTSKSFPDKGSHVVVAMSGGVDSSVAALLLIEKGHQVSGLFMKNWEEDDTDDYCAAANDLSDAQSVCERLGIPLHTVNFSHEYWNRVFTRFLAEYRAGRTPNPDILCNKEIKFKEFLERAHALGADYIATGHYAGIEHGMNERYLLRGTDPAKDQSYFLYTLDQRTLSRSLFPLSGLRKSQVRSLARDQNLRIFDKKDSTGICFIGERRFKDFLIRYLRPKPGDIVDLHENCVGRHDGLMYYTLGQRHGLGLGGPGEPWYVVDKDMETNCLYVVQGHDHPALMSTMLKARQLHWVPGCAPSTPYRCCAKTRYRDLDHACVIEHLEQGTATVRFDEPQRAVTPGQSVVFYQGARCVGGGTIVTGNARSRHAPTSYAA